MTKALIMARGPVRDAFEPMVEGIESQLGLNGPRNEDLRARLHYYTDKMPAAAIAALVEAGYQVVPPTAGHVDVQSQATGSYQKPPFRKMVTVTVRIGDYVLWHRMSFQHPQIPRCNAAVHEFANGLAGAFREQILPLVATGLSELETGTFEER